MAAGGLQLLIGIIWYIMLLLARRNTAETSIPLRSQLDIDSQNTHGVKTDTRQGEFKGTRQVGFRVHAFPRLCFCFRAFKYESAGWDRTRPHPPRSHTLENNCMYERGRGRDRSEFDECMHARPLVQLACSLFCAR